MKRIAILGSTGSIGCSTLKIVESYPDRFAVATLAAGSNLDLAFKQTLRWHPKLVSVAHEDAAEALRKRLREAGASETEVVWGTPGTVAVATHPEVDFVVSAIVGVAGLEATYEAVKAGKEIGLANKECLVAAGELITAEARRQGKPLLPIDSEHNAVHQCLRGGRMDEVERVWLTASGGPFLHTPREEFANITVAQALNHPTWKMGRRITIDSATLMNKGFEVIEAVRLFNTPPSRTYALTWPERIESDLRFDVLSLKHLEFCPPDLDKFPCLRLAYEAVEAGGAKTVALNAADEVAVAAFLEGQIPFMGIPATIQAVLDETPASKPESIYEVLCMDSEARELARRFLVAGASGSRVAAPKHALR